MAKKYVFNPFTGTLDRISVETVPTIPVTTKGDIFTYDTASARLPIGADGRYLEADSGEATGLNWSALPFPLTTKGDIFTYDIANARLPVGADGRYLIADSAEATGLNWGAIAIPNVGGLYGINVEVLAANKTLVAGTDEIYQYLDLNVTSRDVVLDTASATAGDRFVIKNTTTKDSSKSITFKQGVTIIDMSFSGNVKEFIFDGTNWKGVMLGTQDTVAYRDNTAVGWRAQGRKYGTAVGSLSTGAWNGAALGKSANGYYFGAAVGYNSAGNEFGAALGFSAKGAKYGAALGAFTHTNYKHYSVALGYYSETERYSEVSKNIDGSSTQKNNIIIIGWRGTTEDDTPIEILCGGVANQRCTIRASSALTFKIMVTARDNTTGDCAAYIFDGLIKRDAANNTTMSVCNKTVTHEDDATWDCNVTADDANEALIITVTGDATNITQWAARLDGVETHF